MSPKEQIIGLTALVSVIGVPVGILKALTMLFPAVDPVWFMTAMMVAMAAFIVGIKLWRKYRNA